MERIADELLTPEKLNELVVNAYSSSTPQKLLDGIYQLFNNTNASAFFLIDTLACNEIDLKTVNFCLITLAKYVKDNLVPIIQIQSWFNPSCNNIQRFQGIPYLISSLSKLFTLLYKEETEKGSILLNTILPENESNLYVGLHIFSDFVKHVKSFQEIEGIVRILTTNIQSLSSFNIFLLSAKCLFSVIKRFPANNSLMSAIFSNNGLNNFEEVIVNSPTQTSAKLLSLLRKFLKVDYADKLHFLFDLMNLIIRLLNESKTSTIQLLEISFILLTLKDMKEIREMAVDDFAYDFINQIFNFSLIIFTPIKIHSNYILIDNMIQFWLSDIPFVHFNEEQVQLYINMQTQIKNTFIDSMIEETEYQQEIIENLYEDPSIMLFNNLGTFLSQHYKEEITNFCNLFIIFPNNCSLSIIIEILSYLLQNHHNNENYNYFVYLEIDLELNNTLINFFHNVQIGDDQIEDNSMLYYLELSLCNYLREFYICYLTMDKININVFNSFLELLIHLINVLLINKQNVHLIHEINKVFDFSPNVYGCFNQQFIDYINNLDFVIVTDDEYVEHLYNFVRFLFHIYFVAGNQKINLIIFSDLYCISILNESKNINYANFILNNKMNFDITCQQKSEFLKLFSNINFYTLVNTNSLQLVKDVINNSQNLINYIKILIIIVKKLL